MKPRKLPSGNWNVQVYIGKDPNGKRKYRSVTADTRKECLRLASLVDATANSMKVSDMIHSYIETKKNVISPNTYRGYLGIVKGGFDGRTFSSLPVYLLKNETVQKWISECAASSSPKTVRNYYGLFSAALTMYYPQMHISVKLPQMRTNSLHTPTTAEVQVVLDAAKKKNFELYKAILLASVGMMRQGEIAALTAADCDFDGNTISVTKSMALQADNTYTIKPPKTAASVRVVMMPQFVMDLLPKQGKTVDLTTAQITSGFRRLIKKMGCEHFRFHDLRHYAASIAASSSVGASLESIKARGGWATDNVMKRVYINKLSDEVAKDNQNINTFFEQFLIQEK